MIRSVLVSMYIFLRYTYSQGCVLRSLEAGIYQRLGGRSVPRTHVEMTYYRNLTKRCRYRKFRVLLH